MQIRPHRIIKRKKTKKIKVGKVSVGGNSKITVQSMTNTLTTDVKNTIFQIKQLEEAGADIVRVSCPDENSTKSLKEIIDHGFSIKYFRNHSDLCLAGEDKEFINKFMTKSGQTIFKPAIAKDIFSEEDFIK